MVKGLTIEGNTIENAMLTIINHDCVNVTNVTIFHAC